MCVCVSVVVEHLDAFVVSIRRGERRSDLFEQIGYERIVVVVVVGATRDCDELGLRNALWVGAITLLFAHLILIQGGDFFYRSRPWGLFSIYSFSSFFFAMFQL